MTDSSVTKVEAQHSPKGPQGQRYLAGGSSISMRLWDGIAPHDASPEVQRDYETVGYVIAGKAELVLEGQTLLLMPGNSWTVPKGAVHSYRILEPFTAVEATHPPAQVHDRDAV